MWRNPICSDLLKAHQHGLRGTLPVYSHWSASGTISTQATGANTNIDSADCWLAPRLSPSTPLMPPVEEKPRVTIAHWPLTLTWARVDERCGQVKGGQRCLGQMEAIHQAHSKRRLGGYRDSFNTNKRQATNPKERLDLMLLKETTGRKYLEAPPLEKQKGITECIKVIKPPPLAPPPPFPCPSLLFLFCY